jgi:3-hydroxy acid dehydrogenase / malonic semialdehyde reductase
MGGVAVITGASSGIGAATARSLAELGYELYVGSRRRDRLADLAATTGAKPIAVDVRKPASIARFVAALASRVDHVDVLVNNAGLALGLEPAQRADLTDWDRMIGTNCAGLVHMTRALLPGMVERNRGHVVNIGSIAGSYPYPGGNVYGATKAFVRQFSLNLRADLTGTRVRVSNIEPGLCSGTEFSNVRFKGDDGRVDKVYEGTEALTADDIAETVYWMAALPAHFNVNAIEIMPVCQSFTATSVTRNLA